MSWMPLQFTSGRPSSPPLETVPQSPVTRQHLRKRPVPSADASMNSNTTLSMQSSKDSSGPLLVRSLSSGSLPLAHPTQQNPSDVWSQALPETRREMAKSTYSRVWRCLKLFKPVSLVRILGLVALGRLIFSHYYLLSISHQRSLWISNKSSPVGWVLDAILPSNDLTGSSILYSFQSTASKSILQRHDERIQKTRPKMINSNISPAGGMRRENRPSLNVSASDSTEWKALCKSANLNPGSRVLIVNLLSHPTGTATAKLIGKQCGVKQVTGADPILPNLRKSRMELMTVLKNLMRVIPQLQMVVTEPGKGLHEKNRLQPLAWLARARPTHVLVLDPFESADLVESLGGISLFKLYAIQQMQYVWQHLTTGVQQLPVRVLQVAGPLLHDISQSFGKIAVSSWNEHVPFSFATLSLEPFSGPGVNTDLHLNNTKTVFVEKGLRAIMTGWQRPKQFFSVNVVPSEITTDNLLETLIWEDHSKNPFSLTPPSSNQTAILQSRQRLQNHGSEPVTLPCASQCQVTSSLRSCSATAWDHAIDASQKATAGCRHVLYMADFSKKLEDAPHHMSDPALCRVIFVARKSPLAQKHKSETNGKAVSNSWSIVWLDLSENSYSANDSAFLRIDPSRLFSSTVQKAMFVNTLSFAAAPDKALLKIMTQIDRPAVKEGDRSYREIRPGTELKRWKSLPAEPARRSALFLGTPLPENRPQVLPDYKNILGNAVSQRQLAFYQQLTHWVHVNMNRPDSEIRSTVYIKFPFEWTSRFFVVHDLTLETARQLRCEWLEEHLTWNKSPSFWNTEDLSLAFLLGSLKTLEKIGLSTDEFEPGWLPFLNNEHEPVVEGQHEVHIRLMQPREE